MLEWFYLTDTQILILFQIGISVVLGAVIGFEREMANKPAGLRTHMLVSGASAMLVSLGYILIDDYANRVDDSFMRSDPIRIVEAVITGVSFLGAGTIIRSRTGSDVEGLTTAASLLFVAALGIAVALSQVALAIIATLLALITLRFLRWVEGWIQQKRKKGSS
jgi:putative Mg2+ transporter-C (MgtC) family protein